MEVLPDLVATPKDPSSAKRPSGSSKTGTGSRRGGLAVLPTGQVKQPDLHSRKLARGLQGNSGRRSRSNAGAAVWTSFHQARRLLGPAQSSPGAAASTFQNIIGVTIGMPLKDSR